MFGATYLKFQCADLNIQNFVEIGHFQRIHVINRETGGAVQVSRCTIVVSTGSKLFCDSQFFYTVAKKFCFLLPLGFILLYFL